MTMEGREHDREMCQCDRPIVDAVDLYDTPRSRGKQSRRQPRDHQRGQQHGKTGAQKVGFLMVWHTCCGQYSRAARNRAGTHYVGYCPRCGSRVDARIGPEGTHRRMFRTTG